MILLNHQDTNDCPDELTILSEHERFLVAYKPEGYSIHATAANSSHQCNFTAELRKQRGDTTLFPCHRLDTVTSGVVLVAKGEKANSELSQLFERRKIEKYYIALTDKKPKKKQGLVSGDMKPARRGDWKLSKSKENPAVTQFFSYGLGNGRRLFLLKPHTGKTHQIRVAMKSLGAPILGDERYRGGDSDRCYLHAYGISFVLGGEHYAFYCPPKTGQFFTEAIINTTLAEHHPLALLPWPRVL